MRKVLNWMFILGHCNMSTVLLENRLFMHCTRKYFRSSLSFCQLQRNMTTVWHCWYHVTGNGEVIIHTLMQIHPYTELKTLQLPTKALTLLQSYVEESILPTLFSSIYVHTMSPSIENMNFDFLTSRNCELQFRSNFHQWQDTPAWRVYQNFACGKFL